MAHGGKGSRVDADDENLCRRRRRWPQAVAKVEGMALQGTAQVVGGQSHHHDKDRQTQSQGAPQGVIQEF